MRAHLYTWGDSVAFSNQILLLKRFLEENGYEVYIRDLRRFEGGDYIKRDFSLVLDLFNTGALQRSERFTHKWISKKGYLWCDLSGVPFFNFLGKLLSNNVNVVTNSESGKKLLEKYEYRVLDFVWHAIDYKIWKRKGNNYPSGEECVNILTVARNEERKGLHFIPIIANNLLEMEVRNWKWVIVTNRSIPIPDNLKGKVEFIEGFGKYTRENLASFYHQFHIYACTSLWEGFYIPYLEAQASGLVIISPILLTTLELVNPEGNVFINTQMRIEEGEYLGSRKTFYYYDLDEYSYKLADLIDKREKLEEIGKKNIEFAKRYDYKEVFQKFFEIA